MKNSLRAEKLCKKFIKKTPIISINQAKDCKVWISFLFFKMYTYSHLGGLYDLSNSLWKKLFVLFYLFGTIFPCYGEKYFIYTIFPIVFFHHKRVLVILYIKGSNFFFTSREGEVCQSSILISTITLCWAASCSKKTCKVWATEVDRFMS